MILRFQINKVNQLEELKENAPKLTHLSLIDNPIKNLMDPIHYVSSIRKLFPDLIFLVSYFAIFPKT